MNTTTTYIETGRRTVNGEAFTAYQQNPGAPACAFAIPRPPRAVDELRQPWPGASLPASAVTPADDMPVEQFALLRESTVDGDKLCVYRMAVNGDLEELRRYDATPEGELSAKSALAAFKGRAQFLKLMSAGQRAEVQ